MTKSCGPAIDAQCRDALIAVLPCGNRAVTLAAAVSKILHLQAERAYAWAAGSVHDQFAMVLEILHGMQRGISPKHSKIASADSWSKLVFQRLANFAMFEDANDAKDAPPKISYGKTALDKQWDVMRQRMLKDATGVELKDLEPFQTFRWILTEEQHTTLAEWVRAVLKLQVAPESAAAAAPTVRIEEKEKSTAAASSSGETTEVIEVKKAGESVQNAVRSKAAEADGVDIMNFFAKSGSLMKEHET